MNTTKCRRKRWIVAILLSAGSIASSCSVERSLGPIAKQEVLVASSWGFPAARLEFVDPRTDSILFAIADTSIREVANITASNEGKYLAVASPYRNTSIWDVRDRHRVAEFGQRYHDILFSSGDKRVVGVRFDNVDIYSALDFALLTSVSLNIVYPVTIPSTNLIGGMSPRFLPREDESMLILVDVVKGRPVDTIVIEPDQYGRGFQFGHTAPSPNGRVLFCRGVFPDGPAYLLAVGLTSHQVLFRTEVATGIGECAVSPDGSEVWITQPDWWNGLDPPYPGTIDVFDSQTGTSLASLPTVGFSTPSGWPMPVREIEFTSDGRLAFVNALNGEHPVLVVDVKSKRILRTVLQDPKRVIQSIDFVLL
jgi:hypothetical protein